MKIVNTGNTYRIYDDDLKTYNKLPAATYEVCFHKMMGFWLEKKDNIKLNEKVYGVHEAKADKILNSFKTTDRNLGVILSGNKGIGKSLTAKLMVEKAVKLGYPVILVNECFPGVANYISEIKQECVVLFDEFDKTFKINKQDQNGGDQDEFLTLFDGLDQGKKLFIVTANKLSDLSDYLVNRPGRFHYHLRFNYPSVDEIREYLTDKLESQYYDQIEEVVKFSNMTDLNYDCLRAIAFELNMGTPFNDAIKDLNITNYENESRYDLTCILENGMKSVRKNVFIDMTRDNYSIPFPFPSLNDNVFIDFDPSASRWDSNAFCEVCGESSLQSVSWNRGLSSNIIENTDSESYDPDDYDEYPETESDESEEENSKENRPLRPKVIAIFIKRKSNYKNIHYAF